MKTMKRTRVGRSGVGTLIMAVREVARKKGAAVVVEHGEYGGCAAVGRSPARHAEFSRCRRAVPGRFLHPDRPASSFRRSLSPFLSTVRLDVRLRSPQDALNPLLRRRRAQVEASLAQAGQLHTLSLARWRLHSVLSEAIARYGTGRYLDAGSGRSPYRALLEEVGMEVVSIDVEDRSGDVDLLADIQSMPKVASASFDTILCTQVLEHVPRPWDAVAELAVCWPRAGR